MTNVTVGSAGAGCDVLCTCIRILGGCMYMSGCGWLRGGHVSMCAIILFKRYRTEGGKLFSSDRTLLKTGFYSVHLK